MNLGSHRQAVRVRFLPSKRARHLFNAHRALSQERQRFSATLGTRRIGGWHVPEVRRACLRFTRPSPGLWACHPTFASWIPSGASHLSGGPSNIGELSYRRCTPLSPQTGRSLVLSERRLRFDISFASVPFFTLRIACSAALRGQTETAFASVAFTSRRFCQIVVPGSSLPESLAIFQARKQATGRNSSPQRPRRCAEGRPRIHTGKDQKCRIVRGRRGLRVGEVWIVCARGSCAGKLKIFCFLEQRFHRKRLPRG